MLFYCVIYHLLKNILCRRTTSRNISAQYICVKLMFSLNEQEWIINDFLDVTEGHDKTREMKNMKNTCQSYKCDNIKRSMLLVPENIIGYIQEFDDNTVHQEHGELEKQKLENENCRIDALDTWFLSNDFPRWHQIEKYFCMVLVILAV